jgi:hypothetical protein
MNAAPPPRRYAGTHEIMRVLVNVKPKLVVHLPLETRSMQAGAQPETKPRDGFHKSSAEAPRMPAMMSVI